MNQEEKKFRLLLKNLPDAYAYHQVATDNEGALHTSDILARVGGDEFAVVLPGTTLEVGQKMVEKMHHQIEGYNIAFGKKFIAKMRIVLIYFCAIYPILCKWD